MGVENEIIKLAANQGIWAVLFVALLFYVLRNGEKREVRLVEERKASEVKSMEREDRLMTHLSEVSVLGKDMAVVKGDVNEIKGNIEFLKGKVGS